MLFIILNLVPTIHCFLSTFHASGMRCTSVLPPSSLTTCQAKKGGNKKKNFSGSKKKKKPKSPKTNKSQQEQDVTRASQRASVVLPGVKTRAPPWQVLSTKDAKKNVEKEKIRRQQARDGIHEPIPEMTSAQSKSKALLSDANRSLLKWKRFNPSTAPCGMSFIGSYLDKQLPPRLGVPEVAFLVRAIQYCDAAMVFSCQPFPNSHSTTGTIQCGKVIPLESTVVHGIKK